MMCWHRSTAAARRTLLFVGLHLAAFGAHGHGVPAVSTHDGTVVGHTPTTREMATTAPLRRKLDAAPDDLPTALALSRIYIELARERGDARFLGDAMATLSAWTEADSVPDDVRLLQATIEQSIHRFDKAIGTLNRMSTEAQHSRQALLLRSSIYQVTGRFDSARDACMELLRNGDSQFGLICSALVASLSGDLDRSYRTLDHFARHSPNLDRNIAQWIETELAGMAVRRGHDEAAERHLLAALEMNPEAIQVKAAYSQLLLEQERFSRVIELFGDGATHKILLLHLAIAGKRSGDTRASQWARAFEERLEAARRRGDETHLREEAMFMLDVLNEPEKALHLATRNWEVQREPEDMRVLLRSANAAGKYADAEPVVEFIKRTRYEDIRLHGLTSTLAVAAQP